MGTYITKCGLYFKTSGCGEGFYMGNCWGDRFGKDTTHCPYIEKTCATRDEFKSRTNNYEYGDCEGILVSDEEYDYERSIERMCDEYDKQSYEKIRERFGDEAKMCFAIFPDGKGGYTIRRWDEICRDCFVPICAVTKQPRNIAKVYLLAEVEYIEDLSVGFYNEVKKTVIHKKVWEDPLPQEVAERILKNPEESSMISMFVHNKTRGLEYELGFKPRPKILKYYMRLYLGKRDLLEDLRLIEEGYTVIHEIDLEKAKKQAKRDRKKKREEEKELKLRKAMRAYRRPPPKQISMFDKEDL